MTSESSGSKPESKSDKTALMSNSTAPSGPKPTRRNRKPVSAPPQTKPTYGFYRAFEERYRGPRDLIKHRLGVYLPFIEPLRQLYAQCTATDLGCGRGEWLELLQNNGFIAYGVDLDDGMLAACKELGLSVTRQEAIGYLQSLDDNSQCIVSGFHFAEHILFAHLQLLVAEALRVLKPGGLLILETPNPENVVVGTTDFYLDPTHQRPIPPLLLSFLPEFQGFARVKILRLQESSDLARQEDVTLKDVFFGTSPDYAVVAQKNAESGILQNFSTTFDKQYGIELGELANRYDARIERRLIAFDQRVGNVESSAGGMTEAISRISTLQDRLIEANSQSERNQYRATQLIEQLHHAEAQAHDQEQRALAAEALAHDQEQRALAAEAQAHDQEQRALAAEALAHDQEQRALAAEALAHDQEQRALAAEALAHDQEQRALAAEAQAHDQEQRALAAEALAHDQEQRATLAESAAAEQAYQAILAACRADEQQQRAEHAETQSLNHQSRVDELGGSSHHWWLQCHQLEAERNALRQSWSWRITAPVRWVGGILIRFVNAIRRGANTILRTAIDRFQRPLAKLMRAVLAKPAFADRLNRLLLRFPHLYQQLLQVASLNGVLMGASPMPAPRPLDTATPELDQLTPHARRIYQELKAEIEKSRKKQASD
ncbi:MAG: methyltransferase domain-containing protein [Chromatiaceae bacterium]|nr:methyltransferase domain-containing protein [Chromatiaceae bacterium]